MECSKCHLEKTEAEFSRRGKGFKTYCKVCQAAKAKEYYEANKPKRLQQIAANVKRFRANLKAEIDEVKASTPCTDCGRCYPPYVMEYDHLPGFEKVNNVSTLIGQTNIKKSRIYDEIGKCELVCANCHRVRTHNRRIAQLAERSPD